VPTGIPTLREHVRALIPLTYARATDAGGMDASESPDVIAVNLAVATEELLVAGIDEDDLSEFVKRYVAAKAVVLSESALIDYYMVKTRRTNEVSRSGGATSLNESHTSYDKVTTIRRVVENLRAWLIDNRARFLREAGDSAALAALGGLGIAVTSADDPVTMDVDEFVNAAAGVPVVGSFNLVVG
jgi:hypothetical protein